MDDRGQDAVYSWRTQGHGCAPSWHCLSGGGVNVGQVWTHQLTTKSSADLSHHLSSPPSCAEVSAPPPGWAKLAPCAGAWHPILRRVGFKYTGPPFSKEGLHRLFKCNALKVPDLKLVTTESDLTFKPSSCFMTESATTTNTCTPQEAQPIPWLLWASVCACAEVRPACCVSVI